MAETSIEWATHTENYQSGCTKVSPACRNCYALPMSVRIANMGGADRYAHATNGDLSSPQWSGTITSDLEAMRRIFRGLRAARKPRRVFLNSMTDTFHADVPEEVLDELAAELRTVPDKHVVMLLTKRPARMLAWQRKHFPEGLPQTVWAGTTAEDQKRADERIPLLLQIKGPVRFLSMEPMVGPVTLIPSALGGYPSSDEWSRRGSHLPEDQRIDWVIVGGESGRGARPMHPDWVRQLRDECQAAGVPLHFKQWGEWLPKRQMSATTLGDLPDRVYTNRQIIDGDQVFRVGKKEAGRQLDGRTWDEVPRA